MTATADHAELVPAPVRTAPWPKARYDHEDWREAASCRDLDRELFFPTGTKGGAVEEIRQAKAVCQDCPVQSACLQFALTTNQEFGIWGGCDEEERHVLRREWRAASMKLVSSGRRRKPVRPDADDIDLSPHQEHAI